MDTSGLPQPTPDRYSLIASKLHTILLLAAVVGWTLIAKIFADQLRAASNPNRLRLYLITIFVEWFFFVLVLAGVRRSGASVLLVLGDRWCSARQVLRDIGFAVGFWIVALALLVIFARLLRIDAQGRDMQFFLPHGTAEIILWLALSVSAGICEETIFRGYLQRQFMALTRNAPGGVRCRARVLGLPASDSDRVVRRHVRNSGPLAPQRSPWNDRPCLAGFPGRGARQFSQALEPAGGVFVGLLRGESYQLTATLRPAKPP